MTEDEMVGWHHQPTQGMSLSRLWEFDGEGNLACFSPLGRRVRHELSE